jgi:hypothetical protein
MSGVTRTAGIPRCREWSVVVVLMGPERLQRSGQRAGREPVQLQMRGQKARTRMTGGQSGRSGRVPTRAPGCRPNPVLSNASRILISASDGQRALPASQSIDFRSRSSNSALKKCRSGRRRERWVASTEPERGTGGDYSRDCASARGSSRGKPDRVGVSACSSALW